MRQILLANYRSVVTGHWKGWTKITDKDSGKELQVQEYDNGDECPGFGKRYTLVQYIVRRVGVAAGADYKGLNSLPSLSSLSLTSSYSCAVQEGGEGARARQHRGVRRVQVQDEALAAAVV